jgi:hypothetical protein
MHFDIAVSMIIYTAATVAFYLLGAGVLHGMGLVPASADMIPVLSNLYTQTLGGWALGVFYVGAIATLYGTVFAATAAHSRMFADMVRLSGRFDADDLRARTRLRNRFVVALGIFPVALVLTVQAPVTMVMMGGIIQAIMLPIIGIGAIYLRHRRLPREIAPSPATTAALWMTTAAMMVLMAYYAVFIARG